MDSVPADPQLRRFKVSTEVPWNTVRAESFRFLGFGFDVRHAKAYLAGHVVPVEYAPAERLEPWMQSGTTGARNPRSERIDPSRVASADPENPLIFVETPRGMYLVDGHHRLERGRGRGDLEYPLVVIRDPLVAKEITRGFTWRVVQWWLWRGPMGKRHE